MAAGDIFTAQVQSIAPGGSGVLRLGGRAVFMALSAPGDTVSGRITAEHRDWAEAELLDIHEVSPLRTEPACPLYGICGGCSLQHIQYGAQLEIKKTILQDAFRRIGGFASLPACETLAGNPWEYRNRVSFHVYKPDSGAFRPGFKARKSADIVPLDDCPAADPGIRAALRDGKLLIPPGGDRFTVYARGGLVLSEAEQNRGTIRLGGKNITLEASCFFQSNAAMLEQLLPVLRGAAEAPAVDASLRMADLYAGAGVFSLFLAACCSGVDLLEQNPRSLELARRNLADCSGGSSPHKEPRFRFFAQSDEAWARRLLNGRRGERYGFAVTDPPRQGMSKSLLALLASEGPPVVAYVSCEPSTQARDCRILASAYNLEHLWFFDFYPHTAHIESLALLVRRPRHPCRSKTHSVLVH